MNLLPTTMIAPHLDIRWARTAEAGDIVRLLLISSDGLAPFPWRYAAAPDVLPGDAGVVRDAQTDTAAIPENCLLAEWRGEAAGMVQALRWEPPAIGENSVGRTPGSLFVAGLAVYARYRGQGIGTELLDCVEGLALARSCTSLSLICFERNERALAFLLRRGFTEVARRPARHSTPRHNDGHALLLSRDV